MEPQSEEASIEESLTGSADLLEQAEEESAGSGGAFNPVTGEINWDCPCLGGMAHGPCGIQFREAFSCFVFSEKEPKGIDCVEKFKAMQDCFREHPDVYGEGMKRLHALGARLIIWCIDIMNDDDDEDEELALPAGDSPGSERTADPVAQTFSESQAEQPTSTSSASSS